LAQCADFCGQGAQRCADYGELPQIFELCDFRRQGGDATFFYSQDAQVFEPPDVRRQGHCPLFFVTDGKFRERQQVLFFRGQGIAAVAIPASCPNAPGGAAPPSSPPAHASPH